MGKRRGREEEEVKMYSIFELFKKIYILFVFLGGLVTEKEEV